MTHSNPNRLPGFAHYFDSSFSSLDQSSLVGDFNNKFGGGSTGGGSGGGEEQLVGPLGLPPPYPGTAGTGLDLSLVNGLDLTGPHYGVLNLTQQSLNLSSSTGAATAVGQSSSPTAGQNSNTSTVANSGSSNTGHGQAVGGKGDHTLLHNSQGGQTMSMGDNTLTGHKTVVGQSEMVLNLSTQIGLNLTRPGHSELEYTMLAIEGGAGGGGGAVTEGNPAAGGGGFTPVVAGLVENSATNDGGAGEEFSGYYGSYYDTTGDSYPGVQSTAGGAAASAVTATVTAVSLCHMEEQRSSPLNLEHRSSPLNLTAVGNIRRNRKPTANSLSNPLTITNNTVSFHNQHISNSGILGNTTAQQHHQQQTDFSYEVYDYRLPNKLTAFYNQQQNSNSHTSDINQATTGVETTNQQMLKVSTEKEEVMVSGNDYQSLNFSYFDAAFGHGPGGGLEEDQYMANSSSTNTNNQDQQQSDLGIDLNFEQFTGSSGGGGGGLDEERGDVTSKNSNSQNGATADMLANYDNDDHDYFLVNYSTANYLQTASSQGLEFQQHQGYDQTANHHQTTANLRTAAAITTTPSAVASSWLDPSVATSSVAGTSHRCKKCPMEFKLATDLLAHSEIQHKKVTPGAVSRFSCQLCKLHFMEESQLLSHNKIVHDLRTLLKGGDMDNSGKSAAASSRVSREVGKQPMNMSTTQGPSSRGKQIFERDNGPQENISDPIDLAPLKESVNSSSISNVSSIKNLSESEGLFHYQCMTCDEKFLEKDDLLSHVKGHNDAKRFKCNTCNLGFTHASAKSRHEKAHTNRKPHACDKCEKTFGRRTELNRHYERKHAQPTTKISCQNCGQMFGSEREVVKHECSARVAKVGYKCELCDSVLEKKVEWGVHMWKHTKDAAYIIISEDMPLPNIRPKKTSIKDGVSSTRPRLNVVLQTAIS